MLEAALRVWGSSAMVEAVIRALLQAVGREAGQRQHPGAGLRASCRFFTPFAAEGDSQKQIAFVQRLHRRQLNVHVRFGHRHHADFQQLEGKILATSPEAPMPISITRRAWRSMSSA